MTDYDKSISSLEKAIASGTLEVTIGDQTVKYASFNDLKSRLNYFKALKAEYENTASESIISGGSVQAIAGRGIRR